jgi:hypothetical protein
MRGISILVAIVLGALALDTRADDPKKGASKTLAEEAQLLTAGEVWISERVTLTGKNDEKFEVSATLRFAAEKGKPSGAVVLGAELTFVALVSQLKNTFELVEKDGKRSIIITHPDQSEVTTLVYKLDGDKLIIESGDSRYWMGRGVVSFKSTTFKAFKEKK